MSVQGATPYLETIKNRRTYYQLKNSAPIGDDRIQEIIKEAILHIPTSFNSQTSRVVLLAKKEHEKLWDITKEVLKGVTPAEQFEKTEQKLNGFQAGYATILYYTHRPTVQEFQNKFALYADKFPHWATQSDGMLQHAVWTALEAEGFGANLQHYNPLIDAKVASTWNVPEGWELSAQMVIGTPTGSPFEKTFKKVEGERFLSFGVEDA